MAQFTLTKMNEPGDGNNILKLQNPTLKVGHTFRIKHTCTLKQNKTYRWLFHKTNPTGLSR